MRLIFLAALGLTACSEDRARADAGSIQDTGAHVDRGLIDTGTSTCDGAGLVLCGLVCRDLSSDPLACGACDNACGEGSVCIDGVCEVPVVDAGLTDVGHDVLCDSAFGGAACGTTCSTLGDDRMNCGRCGRSCDAGLTCIYGSCVPAGTELPSVSCSAYHPAKCDGRWVDLFRGESDGGVDHFCGACDVTCQAGEFCTFCRCTR